MLPLASEAHNIVVTIKSTARVKLGCFYKTALNRLCLRVTLNFWSSFLYLQSDQITDMYHHHPQLIMCWESQPEPLHARQMLYQLSHTHTRLVQIKTLACILQFKMHWAPSAMARAICCVSRIRLRMWWLILMVCIAGLESPRRQISMHDC